MLNHALFVSTRSIFLFLITPSETSMGLRSLDFITYVFKNQLPQLKGIITTGAQNGMFYLLKLFLGVSFLSILWFGLVWFGFEKSWEN